MADFKTLTRIRLHKVLLWGLVDWTVIAGAFLLLATHPHVVTFFLAALIIGNRQHALGIIGHEGAHHLVSRNRRMNDFITNVITFWPLGGEVSGYRGFHLAHHRAYLTPNDPERAAIQHDMGDYFQCPLRMSKVLRVLLMDVLGLNAVVFFRLIKVFNEHIQPKKMIFPTCLHLALWTTAILTGYWYLPAVWAFAMVSGYVATFRIRIWTEHIGIHETHRTALPGWFAALFAPHNTSHHWEHHRNPGVPFYHLPEMRKLDDSVELVTLRELVKFHQSHSFSPDHFLKPEVWEGRDSRLAAR